MRSLMVPNLGTTIRTSICLLCMASGSLRTQFDTREVSKKGAISLATYSILCRDIMEDTFEGRIKTSILAN
ncbi:exported protein of unknown function [Cardinium endosymbiont cEper1 of Encarsia pergandiella]|nr:exported protein of unknown function [Cardinium endosymbiont cEper1 of Encarsia pergandiella]